MEKCMLEPTNRLLALSKEMQIQMTFFVDVGYLLCLEKFAPQFPQLTRDLQQVKQQIAEMVADRHSVQLHIHPHWENSFYSDGVWVIQTKGHYKLADFTDEEVERIVTKYKSYLDHLVGTPTTVFRAGGWCIQPFSRWAVLFERLKIRIDSSVFQGGKFDGGEYAYDFSSAPNLSQYRFSTDVCVEDKGGYFSEFPIAAFTYSPLFYWRLYLLGRLFPSQHKMIGDGNFLAQPGRKKSVLTSYTRNHVSTDGYYAAWLSKGLSRYIKAEKLTFVVIGHPKGMTEFSYRKLKRFVLQQKKYHSFLVLNDEISA